MNTFETQVSQLFEQITALKQDTSLAESNRMADGTFVLPDQHILCEPRDNGDSRYPYGRDGFNFWAYASGYTHANDGLFSPFLRAREGQEPNVTFFAGIPQPEGSASAFLPVPMMPVPVFNRDAELGIQRFSVLSPQAVYYLSQIHNLRCGLRVFVDQNNAVCLSLFAQNMGDTSQQAFFSSYFNPFLRQQLFETDEDRWFKEIKVGMPAVMGKPFCSFIAKVNEDKDRFTSTSNFGVIRRQYQKAEGCEIIGHQATTSRYQYVGGTRGSLHAPAGLYRGSFSDNPRKTTTFNDNAIVGTLLHVDLDPGAQLRIDIIFNLAGDQKQADALAQQTIDSAVLDKQLVDLKMDDDKRHSSLALSIAGPQPQYGVQPEVLTGFFEHLKRQVEFCSLIKGYIQLSPNSLIGIRDVFQAIEGLVFWQPEIGRSKMLEALDYTCPDGRCPRQYSLPNKNGKPGAMDLRPFIDQGVWVISTLMTYLRLTGDTAFLKENCGYHEIIDEGAQLVRRTEHQDSVLEHLFKILDYLLEHRDPETGCVRALYGDWNDALDGLGIAEDPNEAYGSGVSVMVTLQTYQNTCELIELLECLNDTEHSLWLERYTDAKRELAEALKQWAVVQNDAGEQRILHGWGDKRNYLVGSFKDPDSQPDSPQARDSATANAFWVLSGMLEETDNTFAETILKAFERLDSKYGIKTFEPAFPEDVQGVGRIGKLPPGTAENGAAYVHATLFAVMALFKMGQAEKGWEQLFKVLPFSDAHTTLSHSPFVIPNSYGENPEKHIDGQSMNDWQTGSSNVLLKLLIRYVYGFEPTLKGIWIQPAAYFPFASFDFSTVVRGKSLRIQYRKDAIKERSFSINGQSAEGLADTQLGIDKLWLPYTDLEKEQSWEIAVVDNG